jgi:hypothetical protein
MLGWPVGLLQLVSGCWRQGDDRGVQVLVLERGQAAWVVGEDGLGRMDHPVSGLGVVRGAGALYRGLEEEQGGWWGEEEGEEEDGDEGGIWPYLQDLL